METPKGIPNGWRVIARKEVWTNYEIVLCERNPLQEHHNYVTWSYESALELTAKHESTCTSGNYIDDKADAFKDFYTRNH